MLHNPRMIGKTDFWLQDLKSVRSCATKHAFKRFQQRVLTGATHADWLNVMAYTFLIF